MPTFVVEDFPAELIAEVTRSAAGRRVPVGAELARMVTKALDRATPPPPLPFEFSVDVDHLLTAPGPPYIMAGIEFQRPSAEPIVPVDQGPARFRLCCDVEEMPS